MATALTDSEITALRAILEASESLENVNTVLDLDEADTLALSNVFYVIQGTGSNRDRKLTLEALMYFIKNNVETLSKMKLTFTGSGYGLDVDGKARVRGLATFSDGAYIGGSVDIGRNEDTFMEVHCPTKFFDDVTFDGDINAGGHAVIGSASTFETININPHQAGSGDGFSFSMTSNGLNVKDNDNVSVLRVSAEEAVTGETSRMDVVARVYFDGNVTFESGVRFYGNVSMGGNVDVGSATSKKVFNVNGNDFYVDTDGTTHAAGLEATSAEVTLLTASKAEVGRLSTNFSRVTANVNLNTTYSTLKQKERIVIYNDSASDITATLDSTGNHTTVLRQCCMEFICVAYDSTNGPTWRPIEGRAPIS